MLEYKNKNTDESTTGRYSSTTILKKRRREKKKKGGGEGRPWLWRAGPKQGEGWGMGGANAQDPQGGKRPWGLWEVGLRLKEQKGPRLVPHPWSQRAGDLTWEPSRLPGLEWVEQTPSSPLLLLRSGV